MCIPGPTIASLYITIIQMAYLYAKMVIILCAYELVKVVVLIIVQQLALEFAICIRKRGNVKRSTSWSVKAVYSAFSVAYDKS